MGNGANVLVTAASGGVRTYAVQLAKLGNRHVTATCGARNQEVVRSLGADEVVDYKTTEGASPTNSSGKNYMTTSSTLQTLASGRRLSRA